LYCHGVYPEKGTGYVEHFSKKAWEKRKTGDEEIRGERVTLLFNEGTIGNPGSLLNWLCRKDCNVWMREIEETGIRKRGNGEGFLKIFPQDLTLSCSLPKRFRFFK
jgi:hypothetical protein